MAAATSSRTRIILTAFGLFCCSLFLTAYSAKNPQAARIGYVALAELHRPMQLFTQRIFEQGVTLWRGYLYLVDVRKENEQLRSHLRKLESEVVGLSEVQAENDRLAKILRFVQETQLDGVVARVIGRSPSNWVQSVTLNKGSLDGISVDMAVVDGHGVVGQIIEVSPHVSNVLLATDATSGVDSLLQESRARGVISGTGRGSYILKFVPREQEVKIGDRIVTSGIGGVFPSGLLLGSVGDVKRQNKGLFQEVEVVPAVDFSRLEEVLVLTRMNMTQKKKG